MKRRVLLAALAIATLAPVTSAWAKAPSLDRILPAIERQLAGTLLDARGPITSPDGKQHYEIKWLTPDGRVLWLSADATTGTILHG